MCWIGLLLVFVAIRRFSPLQTSCDSSSYNDATGPPPDQDQIRGIRFGSGAYDEKSSLSAICAHVVMIVATLQIYKYTNAVLSAGDHAQNPFGNTTDGLGCSLAVFLHRPFAHGYGGEPASSVHGCDTLDKMPFREAWYGMYFKEDKVGYSHFKIEPDGKNFNILSDSVMRLTALKKTNEITMKERVVVKPDLSLISFDSKVHMHDKDLHMVGKAEGNKFLVDIELEVRN